MGERKIFEAISDKELLAEVERRGLEMPAAIGMVASSGAGVEAEAVKSEFEKSVEDFLNPEADLDVNEQLTLMREFWGKLGYELPALSDDQQTSLQKTLEANPLKRVVPAPFLPLIPRQEITAHARHIFPLHHFTQQATALWTPDTSWIYGRLLRNPESTVKDGGRSYGLRYKAPDGLADRSAYIASLTASGQTVAGSSGEAWVFPVFDAGVRSERTYTTAGDLYDKVEPTETPEALIAMQLLHQANGTPNPVWEVDFANEAVYQLHKKSVPKALVRVAGVYWSPSDRRVRLSGWGASDRRGAFGVRRAVSGL